MTDRLCDSLLISFTQYFLSLPLQHIENFWTRSDGGVSIKDTIDQEQCCELVSLNLN